jgi:hypothetical protein
MTAALRSGMGDVPGSVAAGPLGGIAKCGATRATGREVPVCLWAGPVTVGMVMFLSESRTEATPQVASIRAEIERPA